MSKETFSFDFDGQSQIRLDHFLVEHLNQLTRSRIQKIIKSGQVLVNDIPVLKTGAKLDKPSTVFITIPPPQKSELIPEHIPLNIIYESKDVLVVNKPSGMVVHPGAGNHHGTLIHAALAHAPNIEGVGGSLRPGLIHRLDKDTSGVILLAKNDHTHQLLQDQFKNRTVTKKYIALVDGTPPTPEGRIEAAIVRDPKHRIKMKTTSQENGKEAISEYKVIESFSKHSLLEVQILTGRTHQIRVHLEFIGTPVAGDPVYGLQHPSINIGHQFLHAHTLTINIPNQDQVTFSAELPAKLSTTLAEVRQL